MHSKLALLQKNNKRKYLIKPKLHEKNEFSVKINFFMSKEDVLTSSMFQLWLKRHLKKK